MSMTQTYFDAEGNEVDLDAVLAERDSSPLVKDLRKQLSEARKDAKDKADLEAKVARYERGDILKNAGLDQLNERQRKALEATHDGDWTIEGLRHTATDLGYQFIQSDEEIQLDTDLGADGRVAAAVAGGQQGSNGVITPAEVAEWSTEKKLRFSAKHPDSWEFLKRGEEVVGLTFQ